MNFYEHHGNDAILKELRCPYCDCQLSLSNMDHEKKTIFCENCGRNIYRISHRSIKTISKIVEKKKGYRTKPNGSYLSGLDAKRIRDQIGMTRVEMAAVLEIKEKTLSRIENGTIPLTNQKVIKKLRDFDDQRDKFKSISSSIQEWLASARKRMIIAEVSEATGRNISERKRREKRYRRERARRR